MAVVPTRREWPVRALILLAVALVPVFARPREGDSPQPLSPGTVALLLDGKVGPAEQARWAEALADPRAETRAAAARVAGVAGAVGVVPALLKAVQAETDVGAAREEFLALGTLAPGTADEELFAA